MAAYTQPGKTVVNFVDNDEAPYTIPAANAVNFDLLEGLQIAMPSPLAGPQTYFYNDFLAAVTDTTNQWVMIVTGDPEIRMPITSWQSTQQTDRQSFLQCVVPDAAQYASIFQARQSIEQFKIYRRHYIGADEYLEFVAAGPLQTITLNYGAFKETANVIGYGAAVPNAVNFAGTLTLQNVRTVSSVVNGNSRARGDFDPNMRPGNDIVADGQTITAAYVNVFVTTGGEQYMDVGSR